MIFRIQLSEAFENQERELDITIGKLLCSINAIQGRFLPSANCIRSDLIIYDLTMIIVASIFHYERSLLTSTTSLSQTRIVVPDQAR